MKVAVVGPHGSGNRLMRRILEANGIEEVWLRSFPGRAFDEHPDFYVVMRRGDAETALSMVKEGQANTYMAGLRMVDQARREIAEMVHHQYWTEVRYRALVEHPTEALRELSNNLQRQVRPTEPIEDGDLKYAPFLNGTVRIPGLRG